MNSYVIHRYIIAVAKDGSQPRLNYTIWGYDPFTVNTNKNGNLAVVNLIASDYSGQGILINNELNIGGTGTVAIVGGGSAVYGRRGNGLVL